MLKPFAKNILSLTFKLLEVDNEENVLVCLRIIIELHKQFRPAHSAEITHFLGFARTSTTSCRSISTKYSSPGPPSR